MSEQATSEKTPPVDSATDAVADPPTKITDEDVQAFLAGREGAKMMAIGRLTGLLPRFSTDGLWELAKALEKSLAEESDGEPPAEDAAPAAQGSDPDAHALQATEPRIFVIVGRDCFCPSSSLELAILQELRTLPPRPKPRNSPQPA